MTGMGEDIDLYGFDPLDWEYAAIPTESKFCTCHSPIPVNLSIFRMILICKTCEKDIRSQE